MQDLLFGMVEDEDPGDGTGPLSVAGLNVQGASPRRLPALVRWCGRSGAQVFAFSEVLGKNISPLTAELRAVGFECLSPTDAAPTDRCAIVAARPALNAVLDAAGADGRWLRVRVASPAGTIAVTSVYAPTNGMSAESSESRARWQSDFLAALPGFPSPGLVVGDLNVLEPGHVPAIPCYEDHDYAFYSGIVDSGYVDLYRRASPQGRDASWVSPRFGAQRLDHAFATGAGAIGTARYDSTTVGDVSDHSALIVELPSEDTP